MVAAGGGGGGWKPPIWHEKRYHGGQKMFCAGRPPLLHSNCSRNREGKRIRGIRLEHGLLLELVDAFFGLTSGGGSIPRGNMFLISSVTSLVVSGLLGTVTAATSDRRSQDGPVQGVTDLCKAQPPPKLSRLELNTQQSAVAQKTSSCV